MIFFAIALGLFAQLIFLLGIFHYLYLAILITATIIYWLCFIAYLLRCKKMKLRTTFFKYRDKTEIILLILLLLISIVNAFGALAPELAFDALWYHLTLPKLYIEQHAITHIGGLLYYSDMPKLGELLYVPALALGNETMANSIQFFSGIFICIIIYQIALQYTNRKYALLACIIFYTNIVVDWESTIAYVDLIRAFFEIVAVQTFLLWQQKQSVRYLLLTAIFLGFAIETKLIAIGSLVLFCILILSSVRKKHTKNILQKMFLFIFVTLLVPLPWFIFSYVHTGNPVYPFFTTIYPTTFSLSLFNPLRFIHDIFIIFTGAADPISPIYIICIPLIYVYWKILPKNTYIFLYYSGLALVLWYMTPQTGGGRFLLPYLPVLSILVAILIFTFRRSKIHSDPYIYKIFWGIVFLIAISTVLYRGAASIKYIPVVFGLQSKQVFLADNLNFNYGDFYDTDNYFNTHIKNTDRVLLIGFHNLYYIDFPFVDQSWLQKGERFNYIATQNTMLPNKFKNGKLIYQNTTIHVKLYKKI